MKKIIVFIGTVLIVLAVLIFVLILNKNALNKAFEMKDFFSEAENFEEIPLVEGSDETLYINAELYNDDISVYYSRVKTFETNREYSGFVDLKSDYFDNVNDKAAGLYQDTVDDYESQISDLQTEINNLNSQVAELPDGEEKTGCIIFCQSEKEVYESRLELAQNSLDDIAFSKSLKTDYVEDTESLIDMSKEFDQLAAVQTDIDNVQEKADEIQEDLNNEK